MQSASARSTGSDMHLQVHIKHAGKSKMLFNKFKLQGIAPKIQKLARREGEVSIATSDEPHLPVIRHAKPVTTAPYPVSDDEEVQLRAVSFESQTAASKAA